jgi:hypothetical protein
VLLQELDAGLNCATLAALKFIVTSRAKKPEVTSRSVHDVDGTSMFADQY